MTYRIFETVAFRHDLARLDAFVRGRIEAKLRDSLYPRLREEPHHGPNIRRLRDWTPATWRYRLGPWRLFYEIHEGERLVMMVALDHRREAYR